MRGKRAGGHGERGVDGSGGDERIAHAARVRHRVQPSVAAVRLVVTATRR
jgi:hypothetical protein